LLYVLGVQPAKHIEAFCVPAWPILDLAVTKVPPALQVVPSYSSESFVTAFSDPVSPPDPKPAS
jgi:hypothetical protein